MVATEGEEEKSDESGWEGILRRMLPPGAPLPDEDHLDYSIAVEYLGPLPSHPLPKVNPLNLHHSSSIATSSISDFNPTSLTTFPIFRSQNAAKEFQLKNLVSGHGNDSELFSNSHWNENEMNDDEMRTKVADDDGDDGESSHSHSHSQCSIADNDLTVAPVARGERRHKQRRKNRGVCSRCGKGNRFSHREMCIVCDSKYCRSCVLKAMGSMPEGRKCICCIRQPIHESKRSSLGKISKILGKLCSHVEVNQIMKAEKECFANQLRPDQLVVNGRQLVQEELLELFRCRQPPQNLIPGKYWYDKDSGLWGKVGEKPDRIITSKLNVGGKLQADASNGNTRVYINGREITKLELRVLKLAKVQCSQDTHFWVYDDGSYEEEGQNNIKGNIWEKASTRFISSLLSLPVPPGNFDGTKDDPSMTSGRVVPGYMDQGTIRKLLLLGLGGSGTSTIFNQAKFLYGNNFTSEELQKIKFLIQSNIYKYLGVLLEGRESFEEEALMKDIDAEQLSTVAVEPYPVKRNQCIYYMNPRLKKHADWLLEIMASGDLDAFFPAATREYAPLAEELWRDRSVQETYRRKEELHFLPDAAKYFLDRAVEISSNDYEPSDKDILHAEGVTQSNGLASVEFSFGDGSPMSDFYDVNFEHLPPSLEYQLVRINSSGLKDGCKWLEMFEDVRVVIFCVALSDYDVMWADATGYAFNKMLASRDMFESLVKHPSFEDIPFVLLLNKYDAFEEKINQVPLTVCEWFRDFYPVKLHSNSQSLVYQAYYYVAVKFKELYAEISGQKLYVWPTRGLERSSVDEAFKFVCEVLKWVEKKDELYGLMADDSFNSSEVSFPVTL